LPAGAARKVREKLTDPRHLPSQAIGRLSFYLAIKLSILQESLPTVFTAKWPKDTAFFKILQDFVLAAVRDCQPSKVFGRSLAASAQPTH